MNLEEEKILNNLTSKFSGFAFLWDKYISCEIDDKEDWEYVSLYSIANEFADYILRLYSNNEDELLFHAFNEVEQLTKHSDDSISNGAYVGFVEGVLVARSRKNIPVTAFDRWLGENSKEFWYEMHGFFTTGK